MERIIGVNYQLNYDHIVIIGEVANRLSNRKSKFALQNLSNKLAKGAIKYVEVKKIAEIIGYKNKWIKK